MGVGADAPVFYLDEVGQVLLVERAGVAVQVGVHGGQLLRQHEHLLARERLQPYHRGQQVLCALLCKFPFLQA